MVPLALEEGGEEAAAPRAPDSRMAPSTAATAAARLVVRGGVEGVGVPRMAWG